MHPFRANFQLNRLVTFQSFLFFFFVFFFAFQAELQTRTVIALDNTIQMERDM